MDASKHEHAEKTTYSVSNGSQSLTNRQSGNPSNSKETYNRGNALSPPQPPSYQHSAPPHAPTSHHGHPPQHASQPAMSHGPPPSDYYHDPQNRYYSHPPHDGYHHRPPPPPPPHSRPYPPPPPPHHYPPHQTSEYRDPSHHHHVVPPPPQQYQEPAPRPQDELRHAGGCTCKKSKCLKLYCQCFASSTTCGPKCKCQTCHNTTMHGPAIKEARRVILDRNPSAFDDKFTSSIRSPPPPSYGSYPSPSRTLPQPHYSYLPAPHSWQHGPPPLTHHHYSTSSPPRVRSTGPHNVPPHVVLPNPSSPASASLKSNGSGCTIESSNSSSSSNDATKKRKGCKCRRSHCLKKYCECFHLGNKCGNDCRCYNCKNQPDPRNDQHARPEDGAPVKEVVVPTPCKNQVVEEEKKSDESVSPASGEDRLAIMAAVAMTELFSGMKKPAEDDTSPPPVISRSESDDTTASQQPLPLKKRKVFAAVDDDSSTCIMEKRLKLNSDSPTPSADLDGKHVISSNSSQASVSPRLDSQRIISTTNSRDHSPVSTRSQPPPLYMQQQQQYKPSFVRPPPYFCPPPRYTNNGHPPMSSKHRASPGRSVCSDQSNSTKALSKLTKKGGLRVLPRSLSYRKICSRCGRTRGEHGELGFGNKCVYQDCARCGAGLHMHLKAKVPMGFNCTLCVEQGAAPGASEAYERKILTLAERADIQKELNLQQQQNVQ